jgi:hypothetical protein
MLITPLPGADPRQIIRTLEGALDKLHEVRSQPATATTAGEYPAWVTFTLKNLYRQIRPADLHALLVDHRFASMRDSSPRGTLAGLHLHELEIDERIEIFESAIADLQATIERWSNDPGQLVVVDTNIFLHHPEKFDNINYAAELGLGFSSIRIVLPIAVIDELDRGKFSGGQALPRWRAGYTLGKLDELLRDPRQMAVLQEGDKNWSEVQAAGGMPRGRVTVEILFDAPGHVRLPNADDEIIDRALAVKAFTRRPVHLLTMDTHMSTRARLTDLTVHKVQRDIGAEPELPQPKPERQARGDRKPPTTS